MLKLYVNIRNRRMELGMSQEELATRTGYSGKSMIAHIEKGEVDLPQSKIMLFAQALKMHPGNLMGWDDDVQDGFVHEKAVLPDYIVSSDAKSRYSKLFEKILLLDDTDLASITEQVDMMLEDEKYQ